LCADKEKLSRRLGMERDRSLKDQDETELERVDQEDMEVKGQGDKLQNAVDKAAEKDEDKETKERRSA
jgi:hypothetical protein